MEIKRRILPLLLVVCLITGMMPATALAEENSNENIVLLRAGNVALSANTYYGVSSNGVVVDKNSNGEGYDNNNYKVYFVEEENKCVLYLNDATIHGQSDSISDDGGAGIFYLSDSKPLEIVLHGTNIVYASDDSSNTYHSAAINVVSPKLIFSGDGTLKATAGVVGDGGFYSTGISASNGDIVIKNGTITAIGNDAYAGSAGIYVENGNIYVEGGTVYSNCTNENGKIVPVAGKVTSGFSIGIINPTTLADTDDTGNITITDGTVYTYGGTASSTGGIIAMNNFDIDGGTIYAYSGNVDSSEISTDNNYGIGATGDLSITGGTVYAQGGSATDSNSCGIGSKGDINISGGKITAVGGSSKEKISYGIGVVGDCTITGGEVNATSGEGLVTYGVGAEDDIEIFGGEVVATGGKASSSYSWGIGSEGGIFITYPGSVTATGGFQAIGAEGGYVIDRMAVYAGTSAANAVELQTIPEVFAGYTYVTTKPYCKVSFNSNGEEALDAVYVRPGGTITLPADGIIPPEENQTIKAWAEGSVSGKQYAANSTYTVKNDTTFYAIWKDNATTDNTQNQGSNTQNQENNTQNQGNNTQNQENNTQNQGSSNATGQEENKNTTPEPLKKGTIITDPVSKAQYKVTKSSKSDARVTYLKTTKKKPSTIKIQDEISVEGVTYKVTSVAAKAFKNNKTIKKVTIGSNVTTIGKSAFSGCKKLERVVIGKNVVTIGKNAFYECKKLKQVTIGKKVENIGKYAFSKCTSLAKITIPSNVNKIGEKAFYGCTKLKSITIKTSKLTSKKVGSKAFGETSEKAKVLVPAKKLEKYQKFLYQKGLNEKATIDKNK